MSATKKEAEAIRHQHIATTDQDPSRDTGPPDNEIAANEGESQKR